MSEEISILYAGNDEYKNAFLTALLSLSMKNKSPMHLYFLTGDFTFVKKHYHALRPETIDFILERCKKYNDKISYTIIDCRPAFDELLGKGKNVRSSFSPYSMLRLLIDQYPCLPDRLLYLDGDTIVTAPLDSFYNMDMEGKEIAMVPDIVGHNWLGQTYCNSGVILFDLKKIREHKSLEPTRRFINKFHLFMPDQTALFATFKTDKKLLLSYDYNEQRKIKETTVVRHYCKIPKLYGIYNIKPWQVKKFRRFFKDEAKEVIDEFEEIKNTYPDF